MVAGHVTCGLNEGVRLSEPPPFFDIRGAKVVRGYLIYCKLLLGCEVAVMILVKERFSRYGYKYGHGLDWHITTSTIFSLWGNGWLERDISYRDMQRPRKWT